jgi:hypothetical protein
LEDLEGRRPIEALLDSIREKKEFYKVQRDLHGRVTHLFFSPNEGAEMARRFYGVVLIDCTYKTNRFKMPLLHVCGVTPCNNTFSFAFAFLASETETDYDWAMTALKESLVSRVPWVFVTDRELALMNALATTFPSAANVLCRWHIQKNILSNCKKSFETMESFEEFLKAWNLLVSSKSELEFIVQRNNLERDYAAVFSYLNTTWLIFKERFVDAWMNNILHLGHLVTSRIEGKHAVMKAWLGTSSGDLRDVYNKLTLAIRDQYYNINQQLAAERTKTLLSLNADVWNGVHRKISIHALRKAGEQLKLRLYLPDHGVCTRGFTITHGIPCVHKLRDLVAEKKTLKKTDFHWMWWLDDWESAPDMNVDRQQVASQQQKSFEDILNLLGSQHDSLAPHQQQLVRDEVFLHLLEQIWFIR